MKKPKRPASAASRKTKGRTKKASPPKEVVPTAKSPEKRPAPKCAKTEAPKPEPTQAPKKERGLNSRQEIFCAEYAGGKTATEAYRLAYGNTKTAEAASSRLLTVVKVAERIAALQQAAAATAVLSLAEKRQYLRRVVMTPLSNVDETSDLCQAAEYEVTGGIRGKLRRGNADQGNEEEEPEKTTVKIKMPDKLRAIELDAKLAGELREQVDHKHGVDEGVADLLAAIRSGA